MTIGDIVCRLGRPMRVLEVGLAPDNRGRNRPAVLAAGVEDLAKEDCGEPCPYWPGHTFKADRYWYLLDELD